MTWFLPILLCEAEKQWSAIYKYWHQTVWNYLSCRRSFHAIEKLLIVLENFFSSCDVSRYLYIFLLLGDWAYHLDCKRQCKQSFHRRQHTAYLVYLYTASDRQHSVTYSIYQAWYVLCIYSWSFYPQEGKTHQWNVYANQPKAIQASSKSQMDSYRDHTTDGGESLTPNAC